MIDSVLFETDKNPIPENHIAGYFEGHGGVRLRYGIFKSDVLPPKGTIILLQGRNESIEKYFETIRDLNDAGLWVATFDWRGQGGSDRLLKKDKTAGHVQRFADYERDLEIFIEQVVLPDTRLPFFMVAHSMGGLIALSATPRLENRIDRIVLSAPFLGLLPQPIPTFAVFWLAKLFCLVGRGKKPFSKWKPVEQFDDNVVTSDEFRFYRNQAIATANPGFALRGPTARWLYECMKAHRRVCQPQHLAGISIPTLMLGPTHDQVASYDAMAFVSRRFRAGRLVSIDGAMHELLQEQDVYRLQALEAIKAFIPGNR